MNNDKKILIIADRNLAIPLEEELFSRNMDKSQLKVFAASNRNKAIEFVNSEKFDAILLEGAFGPKNIAFLLNLIKTSKENSNSLAYVASDDLNACRSLFGDTLIQSFRIISLPASGATIATTILNAVFPVVVNKTNKQNVDTAFLKVFIESTVFSLEGMANVSDIEHGKPFFLKGSDVLGKIGLRAKIEIDSNVFRGFFYISFPAETYLKLYNDLLFTQFSEICIENQDFVCEIASIIYGQSKKVLNEAGCELKTIIPVVDTELELKSNYPIVVIPYTSSVGKFYIKIAPNLT